MSDWTNGELLAQVDAFRILGEDECEALGVHFTLSEYSAGDVLFEEGDTLRTLYVVVEGAVDIVLREHGGVERISPLTLATLGPGDCIGEYALVDLRPASASAVVTESSKLLHIASTDLNHYLNHHAEAGRDFYCNLALMLVNRLRQHNEELDLITLA